MIAAAGLAWACTSDSPTAIDNGPLAGLKTSQATDSAGGAIPTPPSPSPAPAPGPTPAPSPTPGFVHGTVRAPTLNVAPPQDTLTGGVKVPGAIVTAYPRLVSSTDTAGVGPMAAQVTADANGKFTLPTLPGGEYIITFNPPASMSNVYGGVWTITTISESSDDYPWWITLWKKPTG